MTDSSVSAHPKGNSTGVTHSTVNLILGPAKSGKTESALLRFAVALDRWQADPCGPPHVWIGPTPSALSDVRDRLAARAQGAWINPRIVTFATLAQEIVSQGRRRVRPISVIEKQRVLFQVIQKLLADGNLEHFATVAHTPGFLRQVSAAIADLKRRDVWAEEFLKRSRTPRDHDFALIYGAYQHHLHEHQLFDAEGRFWAAREELEAKPASLPRLASPSGAASLPRLASLSRQGGEFSFGVVVLDGFADFTVAQHDLLRLLAGHCQELIITLPADAVPNGRPLLFDKPRRTLERLERSFPELQRETASEGLDLPAGLATVEKDLFRDDPTGPPPQYSGEGDFTGLSIIAASGVQSEIREVAKRVKELLLTQRARPDDIAVVFPSVDEVAGRVEEVFDDFGLPFALENRERIKATPLVRTIGKLLRLVVEDWPFEMLLDVVGDLNLQLVETLDRAAVERCIRRAQLPAGRSLLLEQLGEWANSLPNEADAETSQNRLRLVQESQLTFATLSKLDAALPALNHRATVSEWGDLLESLLQRVGTISAEYSSHWMLLKQQFTLVAKIDDGFNAGTKSIGPAEFLDLTERVAAETYLPSATDNVGRVRVLSAEQARNLAVKHLFLAGLGEQSYSSAEGPGSLYRESEIQRFTDAGPATNVAEQQTGEAMLLFYDMATRASESLTLSYAAVDDKGQSLTPSPFLTELERCFSPGAIPTAILPAGGSIDYRAEPASRSDWRIVGAAAALEGKQQWLAGLQNKAETRQLGRAILRSVDCVASRSKREVFGPYEGLLQGDQARASLSKHYGSEYLWSATQLETYAACPYQFFAKQLLRLEPLDDIALRSDHLRKGQLLHQVLAAIHTQLEPGALLDDRQLVERFTAALERLIEETPLKGLEDALREIERREIHAWAPTYSEQELAYRRRWDSLEEPLVPAYFEVRFGPKARSGGSKSDAVSMEVPFVLDLGSEQIKVTGQIDRIDMGRVHGVTVFTVIDYKSGQKVKLAEKDIIAGTQLQLPLYALAAERLLFAERKAVALATGYWSIKDGGFAGGRDALLEFRTHGDDGLTDSPKWSELESSIQQRVGEIVRGARSAHFPVYSKNEKCTQSCDYNKICRIAQIRSLEKVWDGIDDTQAENK